MQESKTKENLFKGVYRVEVAANRMGFPGRFYEVIQQHGKIIMAVTQNRLLGNKSLIGYQPRAWCFLRKHIIALCDFSKVVPLDIGNFIKNAVECKANISHLPGEKPQGGKNYIIPVPAWMIKEAGIEDKAVLVGHGYHFEVWRPSDLKEFKKRKLYSVLTAPEPPDIVA